MHPGLKMSMSSNGGNGSDPHAAARQRARLMDLLIAEQTGTATDAEHSELASHAGASVLEAERELALETALTAVAAVGGGLMVNAKNGYGYGNGDGFASMPAGLRSKLVADAERCLGKSLPEPASASIAGPSALAAEPIIHRGGPRLEGSNSPSGRTTGWGRAAAPWLIAAAASIAAVFAWVKPPAPVESENTRLVAKLAQASDRKLLAFAANVDDYKGVSGSLQWSPSMQAGTMTLKGLRPLAASEGVYQLWIVDGNRQGPPVDGGVFTVDAGANGEAVVPFAAKLPVGKAAAFAITREKAEGVVVSAGPLLLVAAAK
jgi:hypothetical protein